MIAKKFFLVSGFGQGGTELTAFDRALIDAGISQCNLVKVSSIVPKGCKETKPKKIRPGEITFVAIARADGRRRDGISAGLGIALTDEYGVIAELAGRLQQEELHKRLEKKIDVQVDDRGFKIREKKFVLRSGAVQEEFGCAVSVLVYVF